ncbi:MAG TPA: PAS domain-containing protein, partial [Polyangiaceae bacterium]
MIEPEDGAQSEVERLRSRVAVLERELAGYRQARGELANDANEVLLTPEDIPNFFGLLKPNGEVERVNRQLWEFFGGTEETIHEWGAHPEIHHPEDRARIVAEFAAGVGSGQPFVCTYRGRRFDGAYRWLECEQKPLTDKAGRIYRWCVIMRDIDDLVRATEALRERENDLRLIIDTIPGLICLFTPEGVLEGANQQMIDYVGQPVEVTKHWAVNGIVHPDDVPRTTDLFMHSIRTGEPYDFEIRIKRFDGQYRYFKIRGRPHRDSQGRIARWYGLLVDSHERKLAEDALRESEFEQRLIIDTIPGLICLFTPEGVLEGASQQMIDYVGQPVEVTKHWATNGMVHPDDVPRTSELFMHSVRTGDPYDFEIRIRRFDGEYRYFKIRGRPHRNEQGRIVRWYGLLVDSHERKLAEDALRESEFEQRLII